MHAEVNQQAQRHHAAGNVGHQPAGIADDLQDRPPAPIAQPIRLVIRLAAIAQREAQGHIEPQRASHVMRRQRHGAYGIDRCGATITARAEWVRTHHCQL